MSRFRLATTFLFLIVATAIACDVDKKNQSHLQGGGSCDALAGPAKGMPLTVATAATKGATKCGQYVNATSNSYDPEKKKWDLKAAKVSCWKSHADKPLAWRKKYGWAGFSEGLKACGKCLWVKNTATGVQQIVRIVDKCSKKEGLVLDTQVFQKLNGTQQDQLRLEYKYVDCKD